MNNISVSIIIPVYNRRAFIERCIKSVIAQTYQGKLECILVDDSSPDDSIEKAQELINGIRSGISFKIIRHERNFGVSAARNTGISESKGDYIYFLDSDDEITPKCIEQLVKPLSEQAYDMVIGDVKTVGHNVFHEMLRLKLKDGTVLYQPQIIKTYRILWNMLPHNKLYNAKFIKDNRLRFKEGIAYEDELWNLESAVLMKSMRVVGINTYIYYIHGDNISIKLRNDIEYYRNSFKVIISEIRHFMEERHIYNHTLYFFVQWFFLNKYLINYLDNKKLYIEKYREVRPLAWFDWTTRIRANGFILKYHIRDLHYYLPSSIAPYWQHALYKLIKGGSWV